VLRASWFVVGYELRVLYRWCGLGFEIADETPNGGTDSGGQLAKSPKVILG